VADYHYHVDTREQYGRLSGLKPELLQSFGAFNTKKITGQDVVDFVKFRQNVADAKLWDMDMFAEVMGKPQK